MLDLSGRLAGRGVQRSLRGKGRREGKVRKGKGEIGLGNGGVALAPREKFLQASFFSSGQTAVKLSGAEAADRAQCVAPD